MGETKEEVKTAGTVSRMVAKSVDMLCNYRCYAAHFIQEYVDGEHIAQCIITGAVITPLTHKQPCTVDPLNPDHVIELTRTLESSKLGCEVLREVMAKVKGRKPTTADEVMLKVVRATLLAYRLDDDLVESIMGGVIARIEEVDGTREDFIKGVYTPNEVRAMFDQMTGVKSHE